MKSVGIREAKAHFSELVFLVYGRIPAGCRSRKGSMHGIEEVVGSIPSGSTIQSCKPTPLPGQRNPRNSGRLVRRSAVCEPNTSRLPRSAPEIARQSLPAKLRFPDHRMQRPKRGLSSEDDEEVAARGKD